MEVIGWITIFGFFLLIDIIVSVLWSPFLISKRIRSLFSHFPLFESFYLKYILVIILMSLPYLFGFLTALKVNNTGKALFTVVLFISIIYLLFFPIFGIVFLPWYGIDWDQTGYNISTWVVIILGIVWYNFLFSVPLTFISIIYSL